MGVTEWWIFQMKNDSVTFANVIRLDVLRKPCFQVETGEKITKTYRKSTLSH